MLPTIEMIMITCEALGDEPWQALLVAVDVILQEVAR